ncbi:type I restriction-modification system, S subunit [Streptococcus pneumoniae]|nr:type I restriction-modification system, S subunit [Streptococcus pneumoniae]
MNWVVIKIKDIFSINTGLSYKKGDLSINNKGVRIIRGGNIKPLEFSLLDNDYYIDTQFISSEQVYLKHNQLITPVSTSLEHIGKFARIDKDYDGVVAGGFIFQLTPFESSEIISKFLLFNLSSPLFYKQLKAITKLSGQALYNIPKTTLSELLIPLASLISGAVVKNLNSDKVASILIPLPPLSEQQRIVEAIESALEKVDEYAESYNRLEQLDKEFPDKLKKSILQYAMQGKLVEQDPNDESVEVLLEKIRAEKQKLFEEGKIKKKDLDISIVSQGDDNSYYGNKDETTSYPIYEIPEAWRYIKFASLVNFRIGKTPPRSEATFWGTEIPWVSISDMPISGYVTNTRESISKLALKSKKIDISPKGTLLMSFKLSIGKVAILDIPATHNEAIISIFPYANKENIIRDYLMIFLPLISTLGDSKDAIKGKTLNSTSISELLIPISNHEEMKRIISKVDLLFQKVSQLFE